jgi:hypothetical protein
MRSLVMITGYRQTPPSPMGGRHWTRPKKNFPAARMFDGIDLKETGRTINLPYSARVSYDPPRLFPKGRKVVR